MTVAIKSKNDLAHLSHPELNAGESSLKPLAGKRIWIDLDNTPHVPFFAPIVEELHHRGCSVTLTARNAFQVCELADLFHFNYTLVGHHYGRHKFLKVFGLCIRALQLVAFAARKRPDLALSHGSRSQLLAAATLRIPSLLILDYEFVRALLAPTWAMVPEIIPSSAVRFSPKRLLRYPGIKEDVYVPRFVPDPLVRSRLGLTENHLVVTVRPPANEAHYHHPASDELFRATMAFLGEEPNVKMVMLPRNDRQAAWIASTWTDLLSAEKVVIPNRAIDGLNLIWHSDLVISGGGTMNREAAALGVPVYSIFGGKIGAIDRYLADQGRLVLLQSADDIRTKIVLKHRSRSERPEISGCAALEKIVEGIIKIVETCQAGRQVEY